MGAPRTDEQNFFFWARVAMSTAILAFAFAVTISAILNGQTTMWEGVPPGVTIVLFFFFMSIVGMLEGMQIAFFAVARMTKEERNKSAWAQKTCDLLFKGEARNLPGFMVGRQMCVTINFFIIARVTTVRLNPGDPNIFGVSDGAQAFFETGLLGALITTIVASIVWQLVASAFPMAFLSTPLTYFLLVIALAIEWTGLCQGSWVMARVQRKLVGFKRDEFYIGTAEERAEKAKAKAEGGGTFEKKEVEPGHLYPGFAMLPDDADFRHKSVEQIEDLENQLMSQQKDIENRMVALDEQKKSIKERVSKW